ncbi:MAG: hypothetical protein V4451_16275 [Pseudomonadota bacterium]
MKLDIHEILRDAEAQKQARAEQLPAMQDCIRVMVQARLRLEELGWRDACYAPKDGSYFDAITAGYAGPSDCMYLGDWPTGNFFIAEGGDLWPSHPMMFKPKESS